MGYNFVADSTDVSSFVTFSCSRCCSQRWILVPIESTCAISYSTSIYVSLTVFKILMHKARSLVFPTHPCLMSQLRENSSEFLDETHPHKLQGWGYHTVKISVPYPNFIFARSTRVSYRQRDDSMHIACSVYMLSRANNTVAMLTLCFV